MSVQLKSMPPSPTQRPPDWKRFYWQYNGTMPQTAPNYIPGTWYVRMPVHLVFFVYTGIILQFFYLPKHVSSIQGSTKTMLIEAGMSRKYVRTFLDFKIYDNERTNS